MADQTFNLQNKQKQNRLISEPLFLDFVMFCFLEFRVLNLPGTDV
jgi:hypothetical protein